MRRLWAKDSGTHIRSAPSKVAVPVRVFRIGTPSPASRRITASAGFGGFGLTAEIDVSALDLNDAAVGFTRLDWTKAFDIDGDGTSGVPTSRLLPICRSTSTRILRCGCPAC